MTSTGVLAAIPTAPSLATELAPLVQPRLPAAEPTASAQTTTLTTTRPVVSALPTVADAGPTLPIADSTPAPASADSPSAPALHDDRAAVERLVDRYRAAFAERDADAAAAVWPSVDAAALARAFADLRQQNLTLDRCNVDVEREQATASCPGELSYVRRIGPSDPQVAHRVWTFLLERRESGWQIADVTAR